MTRDGHAQGPHARALARNTVDLLVEHAKDGAGPFLGGCPQLLGVALAASADVARQDRDLAPSNVDGDEVRFHARGSPRRPVRPSAVPTIVPSTAPPATS